MGKLIRYCKIDGERVGENVFDVSRCGILGNPYTHIKDKSTKAQIIVKSRDIAIELYKEYFNQMMHSTDKGAVPFQNAFKKIVNAYKKYPEVYIGCYCSLNESCHGDFIINEVRKAAVKESLQNHYSQSI